MLVTSMEVVPLKSPSLWGWGGINLAEMEPPSSEARVLLGRGGTLSGIELV